MFNERAHETCGEFQRADRSDRNRRDFSSREADSSIAEASLKHPQIDERFGARSFAPTVGCPLRFREIGGKTP
jgi:hypothetical protein